MSNNFIINEQTNMKNNNHLHIKNNYNNKIFDYAFLPSIYEETPNTRDSYIDSTKNIGILQNKNYNTTGTNINESTKIRNGSLQSIQSRKELDTRLFPGSPLLSTGQSILKNTDLSSRLKFGEDTRTSKSANALSSYSADNFIPLVPSLAENVQNVDHIIPTFWVRGGMSSRTVIRNIDYLKSSGLKK
jgi:hypothetical protein